MKNKPAPLFSGETLLSGRKGVERDLLAALLAPEGRYTKAEADRLRDHFLEKEAI